MWRLIAVLACLAGPLSAEGWQRLDDAGIAALAGLTLRYDTGWQRFHASGRTLYNAGQDSWGSWAARGGRYCSQWPPADGWACYDVERQGNRIRFVGDSGDVTEGVIE